MTNRYLPFHTVVIASILAFASAQVLAADGKHLFILSGQSNMREPLPSTFTQVVTKVFGKEKVIVVTLGHPSQPIKRWYKDWKPPEGMEDPSPQGNGTLYDELLKSVKKAIGQQKIDTVTYVWMQGEEDARAGWGSVYERSFHGVLDQFKKDLELTSINYVLGRINDFWLPANGIKDGDLVRATQVKLGDAGPNAAWVDTDDLNTGVNPWGGYSEADGHFPPPSYRILGLRFARKACLEIDPKMKLDDGIFKEAIFATSADIKTHAGIGKSVTGPAPDAKHDGGKAGIAALLDGKFGAADASDSAWIGFTNHDAAAELVVDLDAPVEIDAVAINLLAGSNQAGLPSRISFFISDDGKTFRQTSSKYANVKFSKERKSETDGKEPKPTTKLVLIEQNHAPARYIKIEIAAGDQNILVDEIVINPQP